MMKIILISLVVLLFQRGSDAQIVLTLTTQSTPENTAAGTNIIDLSGAIAGDTGAVTYALVEASTQFEISPPNLAVKAMAILDFETTPIITLTISATDAAPSSSTATLTVSLTDVNEPPTFAQANGYILCMEQNATAGTVAGSVTATDVDAGASGTLTYTINAGNTDTTFTMSGSNITVAPSKIADDFPYILEYVATDGDGTPLAATSTVVIVYDVCHHDEHSGAARIVGLTATLLTILFQITKYM